MNTFTAVARWLVLGCLGLAGCASPQQVQLGKRLEWVDVGTVHVDLASHSVVATGFINQIEGPVELFACGPGGKRHESVLVLQSDLLDLQTALLLLGLKSGPPMKGLGDGPPAGAPVRLFVEWDEHGQTRQVEAGRLLWDTDRQVRGLTVGWVFTGSVLEKGKFMALAEESIIATYWDPWALINIAPPYGDDDERLAANDQGLPPIGTPIRLLITDR